MNKGKNKKAAPKVRKKIKLKFDIKKIANLIMMPVITVVIVGIGVFIPAFLLRGKSDIKRLPAGYVDMDEIQPYGAAYQETKQGLTDALMAYAEMTAVHGSYVDISGTYCRSMATSVDRYSQVNAGAAGGEFIYQFSEMLNENYGYEIPEYWEVRDLNEDNVLVGDLSYQGEGFVLDTTSGVPITGRVAVVTTEGYSDPSVCFYELVDMYNEFTGLNFVNEAEATQERDELYVRSILTSDNSFMLSVSIVRQEYYQVEGDSFGEVYTVWYITFDLSDIENDISFIQSAWG